MPSYPNPSAEIDSHYVGAREQLEYLVGTLKDPDAQGLTHGEVEALIGLRQRQRWGIEPHAEPCEAWRDSRSRAELQLELHHR
jgi:hypothetical protein